MKKNGVKRAVAIGLTTVMLLSLAACGKGNGAQTPDYREFVFGETARIEVEKGNNAYFNEVIPYGDKICTIFSEVIYPEGVDDGSVLDGTGEDDMEIFLPGAMGTPQPDATEVTQESSQENVQEEVSEENEETDSGEVEGESESDTETEENPEDVYPEEWEYENFYTIVNATVYNQDGSVEFATEITLNNAEGMHQITADANTETFYMVVTDADMGWYVRKYDKAGTELASVAIQADEYTYVSRLIPTQDGKLIVGMEQEIRVFDQDLKFQNQIKTDSYMTSLIKIKDGRILAILDSEKSDGSYIQIAKVFDVQGCAFGEEYELPENLMYGQYKDGMGTYDIIFSTSEGIFGYTLESEAPVKIMGFVESDIDSQGTDGAVLVTESVAAISYRNEETWELEGIAIYQKTDPSEIQEKDIITVGMMMYDSEIAGAVVEFNKNSETTRIQIKSYETENSDWETAQKAFNNDLISGNCPDVVFIAGTTDQLYRYMEKGTFEPLNSYFEKDAEIKEEDIMPNVKEALSVDGKMYAVAPHFYVVTAAMKSKYVPENGRITFEELMALEEQLGTKAFYEYTQEAILYQVMCMGYEDFLDVRNGKCDFGEEFTEALKYISQYPKEINYDDMKDYSVYETLYRNDTALMEYVYLADFREFNREEKGVFGEEITLVGFPGRETSGAVINMDQILAISSKSKHKDAAWEFVRSFMTTEYQENLNYNFPTRLSVCQQNMEEQMKRPYYTDMDGNKIEYDETYWFGENEMTLTPITRDRAEYVMQYISSVDSVYYSNEKIMDIVREEAEPYFAGQKTAEQAVEIIQSRVQTYVNEGR